MAQPLHEAPTRRQQRRRHAQMQLVALRHEAALQPALQPLALVQPAQRAPQLQAVDRLDAGQGALREEAQHAVDVVGRPVGQAQASWRCRGGVVPGTRLLAQRARVQAVALQRRRH